MLNLAVGWLSAYPIAHETGPFLLHGLESPEIWATFLKVVVIDLVLAGDNAIVIGLAAAGLPKDQRNRAILVGVAAATVLRIAFAVVAVQLLKIIGLVFVGGLLLLWVCWKMWRELRHQRGSDAHLDLDGDGLPDGVKPKTFTQAATQIVIADISMSLDNVLAVAGAAREHPTVLIFGLFLSVALMGLAASLIARLLHRYRWIAYIGLGIIVYVALDMIYRGSIEMWPHVAAVILP
jgi:YjbE family integral membrane protein